MRMKLYVPLDQRVALALRARADQERRRPQDEAAILIERSLGLHSEPAHCQPLTAQTPEDAHEANS